ncbi:MAG: hypothetical protein H7308_09695 [Chthonomonadaceae bacterium]|nr:hypothetical protein [Chthonomonadaceae bacterium]
MDSQTLGILLMFLGLPLIISIPVTAMIWGSHKRKMEAMRLESETQAIKNQAEIDLLEARMQILEKKLGEPRKIQ